MKRPPSIFQSVRPNPPTLAVMATNSTLWLPPSWQRLATLSKRVTEKPGVRGGVEWGWRRSLIAPNQHGVRQCAATQQTQTKALLGLLGRLAIQPDAPLPALYCSGGKVMLGLPCQVSTKGVLLIPTLDLEGNSIDGNHHLLICISKSKGEFRHGVCQTLETSLVHSKACRQGSTLPQRKWSVGGRVFLLSSW
jgi:hypothetical protein